MNTENKQKIILVQKPMIQVVYALIPLVLAGTYFFGLRTLMILAVVNLTGFLSEYIFARVYKQQVSSAVFVSNFLFALSLPAGIPLWIAAAGIVFGIVFGKMVFGGFGKNIFNPAITGRAFIYISFGVPMTSGWFEPLSGFPAGFAAYLPDAVSEATPLFYQSIGEKTDWLPLLLGNVSGSLGETSAILIVLAGLYLMYKKIANWKIVVSAFVSFMLMQGILYYSGLESASDPLSAALAGSFMFALIFMITDPVSSSQTTDPGRVIYGSLFGILTVLIRIFSVWPEAVTFSILLVNMFAPLIDYIVKESRKKGKPA
jgi:Na+-transporting NADH:ubiquinone oxidoreductase subunit B